MNLEWLLNHANTPIKYILTQNPSLVEDLPNNAEVQVWLARLQQRAQEKNLNDIHGSHDYRMENILGKCWVLGLNKEVPQLNDCMLYILQFSNAHLQRDTLAESGYGKLYATRDYETVLCCFLPFLGYQNHPAVQAITAKRIRILYNFAKQKRYDIYVDASNLKGIKSEWRQHVINPDLYADGNITLPTVHDFILFAGMYQVLDALAKQQVEAIMQWVLDERYAHPHTRYGYFYVPDGAYAAKAIVFKMQLVNPQEADVDTGDLRSLLFICFVLSHFQSV